MEQFTAIEKAVSFMLWATDVLMAHQEGQAQKTHAVATALIYHKSDWESIHCDAIKLDPKSNSPILGHGFFAYRRGIWEPKWCNTATASNGRVAVATLHRGKDNSPSGFISSRSHLFTIGNLGSLL